ncbi:hypothetical protein EON68_04190 [archaeon]|nr:MAG: hypothetical protein EON68_04190 [archaeon]
MSHPLQKELCLALLALLLFYVLCFALPLAALAKREVKKVTPTDDAVLTSFQGNLRRRGSLRHFEFLQDAIEFRPAPVNAATAPTTLLPAALRRTSRSRSESGVGSMLYVR